MAIWTINLQDLCKSQPLHVMITATLWFIQALNVNLLLSFDCRGLLVTIIRFIVSCYSVLRIRFGQSPVWGLMDTQDVMDDDGKMVRSLPLKSVTTTWKVVPVAEAIVSSEAVHLRKPRLTLLSPKMCSRPALQVAPSKHDHKEIIVLADVRICHVFRPLSCACSNFKLKLNPALGKKQ